MYKKLFTIIVWLTALTMLWMLPFGSLPTQPVQAAASQQPSLASVPLPPVMPPAPPLEELVDPLQAIFQMDDAEYSRLYRGQPAWPKPPEQSDSPDGLLPLSTGTGFQPPLNPPTEPNPDDRRAAVLARQAEQNRPPSANPTLEMQALSSQPLLTPTPTPKPAPLGQKPTLLSAVERSAPAYVDGTATIQGRVTSVANVVGIANVQVMVRDSMDWLLGSAFTDANGDYSLAIEAPNLVKVEFIPPSTDLFHIGEFFFDQTSAGATLLNVEDGVTLSGIDAMLELGGALSGVVTNLSTGLPHLAANVYLSGTIYGTQYSATTDSSGQYTVRGLRPDNYRVEFYPDQMYYPGMVPEFYDNKSSWETADLVSVTSGVLTTGINAALEDGGRIAGQVTDAVTGAPVPDVQACARTATNWWAGCAITQADGTYTITGLLPDSYRVEFMPPSDSFYLYSWFLNKTSFETADAVVVQAGLTNAPIDGALVTGGKITGTVTNTETGALLPYVYINAYDFATGAYHSSTTTNESGAYTLGNLPAGQYKVYFSPDNWTYPDLTVEWYNNQHSEVDANSVTVTTGAATTNINAALEEGGRITGRVTRASDGAPLQGVAVSAVVAETNNWMRQSYTDENGNYTLTGLAPGNCKVNFQGISGYIGEWYQDQPYFETATVLPLTAGQVLSGVNAALIQAGQISGVVIDAATHQGVANILVRSYDTATGDNNRAAWTDMWGAYTLSEMPPGSYQVYFEAVSWQSYPTPVVSEWFDNQRTQASANIVNLAVGATITGINAELEAGATIRGRVTRASDGAPVAGVYVGIMDDINNQWVTGTNTDTNGDYTLSNLAAGTYVVYFSATDYRFEYYQDARDLVDATRLTVDYGDVLSGINASLEAGGKVSGRVTSETNDAPLEGVYVYAVSQSDRWNGLGYTNANGEFLSEPLEPGYYTINYIPEWGPEFTAEHISEWYKDKYQRQDADLVLVQDGETRTGLDASLTRGGIISGVVTDEDTGLPIENVTVEAYIPGYDTRSSYTDEQGVYKVKGLPSGSASVSFYTFYAPQYIPEHYNNHDYLTYHRYDPVPVILNEETTGINAALAKGVSLSGTVVSDADQTPLYEVNVNIYDANGNSWGNFWTNPNGQWHSWGLPDGDYSVWYYVNNNEWVPALTRAHLSEWRSDAGIRQNGDMVTLSLATSPAEVELGSEGLELGSTLSGTVTAEGGAPLDGVYVEACPMYFYSGDECRDVNTAANGSYTLTGLYPGRYSLGFYTANASDQTTRLYASERYQDLPWYDSGTELRVPRGAELTNINAVLEAGGFIRGTVTASDTHAPLGDVEVDFFTADGNYAGYAVTNLSGEYVSPALPSGEYKVQFFPYGQSAMYGWEWYDNQLSLDDAAVLSLSAGGTLEDIDAALDQASVVSGGVIQGRVTAQDSGLPVANTAVTAWPLDRYEFTGPVYGTQTDAQGRYSLPVSAGTYALRFAPPSGMGLAYEWYDNRGSMSEASPVLVAGGSTFTANAVLGFGGSLIGTVTDAATGNPLPNATVYVIDPDGISFVTSRTDENGQYVTKALPSGTFSVMFYASGYLQTLYGTDSAHPYGVPVIINEIDIYGIDAALDKAAILAGRVSAVDVSEPVAAQLVLQTADNRSYWFTNQDSLSSRGEFAMEVTPGDYTLYAIPEDPYNQDYQGEYFDHVYTLAEAIVLLLPEGTTKNKVWVGLDSSGGKISGRSTDATGERAEFSLVVFYNADGEYVAETTADFYGYYTSPLLAPGNYRLLFVPWSLGIDYGTWLPEYYTDRYSLETALPVTVLAGKTTPNINVSYETGNYQFTLPGDAKEEGFGFYDITVMMDAPSAMETRLPITFGGTATQGEDYIPLGSEIIIPAGETSGTFRMDLLEDSLYEVDETVTLELGTSYFGLPGAQTTFLLTLLDNEAPLVLPAPAISLVSPDQSRNHVPVELTITGANFTAGSQVSLTGDAGPFYPPVTYVHSGKLTALLPAGLAPGVYDVSVQNPDGQLVIQPEAYQSLSPIDSDLLGASYELWTSPTSVYEGTTVQLGQVVSRLGGETTLSNVAVRFYLGDPAAGGTLLGTGSVASLAPNSQASTTGISWTTPAAGSYTLYAVIDPANAVTEANETNNTVSRSVTVLPMPTEAPDLTPPVVNSFTLNGGARSTSQQTINLSVSASDADPGSVAKVKFIEYVYNEGSGLWQEGQASSWMTYASTQVYPWTLLPGAGARYLQAWAADSAGNVSLLPQQTWINYLPAGAALLAGQSHYYLFELATGAGFTLTVTPTSGDPDLYVFAPDFYIRPPWLSISASTPDWVSFEAPLSGMYVARVFGYTDTTYTLTYTSGTAGKPPAPDAVLETKELLTEPGLEPEETPSDQRTVEVPVAVQFTFQLYLPLVRE